MSEAAKEFQHYFWPARREHNRGERGEKHEAALEYAREHGLDWAESLLRASALEWAGETEKARGELDAVEDDIPAEAGHLLLFVKSGLSSLTAEAEDAARLSREAAKDPHNERPGPAWNNLGVALENMGEHEEAADAFRRTLEQPDYETPGPAWNNLGVALKNMGEYDEAVDAFRRALEDPNLSTPGIVWRNLAIVHRRAGNDEEALEALSNILDNPGQFPEVEDDAVALRRIIKSDMGDESLSPEDRARLETAERRPGRGPEQRILEKIGGKKQSVYENYQKEYEAYKKGKDSGRDDVVSILRGWSSAVPVLEGSERHWRGGGYFLKWKGKGIVIDPGFDFIRNFHDEKCYGHEIDAVLVSHNHPDHNADLRNIDDLKYELYKRSSDAGSGQFPPYVLLMDSDTASSVSLPVSEPKHRIQQPYTFQLPGSKRSDEESEPEGLPFSLEYFSVEHSGGINNPVGFKLKLMDPGGGEEGNEQAVTIGYTGDTQYFEDLPERLDDCDLLIAHISQPSIEELRDPGEMKKNHLGYRGVAKLVSECGPRATVVSEFWAGLADIRIDLVKALRNVTDGAPIIPGGIGLHIYLPDLKVECTQCGDKVSFGDVHVSPPAEKFGRLAYLCDRCLLG